MCGIAGIVAPLISDREVLMGMAASMANTLCHRGPDDYGVWIEPAFHLAFSHRRLSVQDLSSAGHQPMASSTGRFHIVLNGEIYNFQLLSDELLRLGHIFRGHSDTEVLLMAIEQWGLEETLQRITGMFAWVVWDNKEKELILCRDRMGEKPLFFGWVDKCFAFASELKALKQAFPNSLEIDQDSLASFFRFGYVPTPHAIYKNVFKLQPGTILRVPLSPLVSINGFSPICGKTKFSPQPYWSLGDIVSQGLSNPFKNERDAINEFDKLLQKTVSQEKIADVPIGAFLSGGIDSSLVSAVMQAVTDKPIKTFTIGFKEKNFDEAPYARAIAKHIGSDHHEHYVSARDGLDLIENIPYYWDEPFADSSQIPSLLIAKIASQNVKVCLTGDGGDELFCGYNRYFANANLWALKQKMSPKLAEMLGKAISIPSPKSSERLYSLFNQLSGYNKSQANIGLKMQKLSDLLRITSIKDTYFYLMSYWRNPGDLVRHYQEADSIIDRKANPNLGSFIFDAMYWDQLGYLVDDNLVKGDRSSMAFSLETRMPLLDHHIVEFSWRIPLEMKYRRGQSKWILRQTLYRYIPKKLIERPKMGFSVPISDWLKGPLKDWAADLINSKNAIQADIFNKKTIQEIWNQHMKGSRDHSHKIWAICMFFAWLERYHS